MAGQITFGRTPCSASEPSSAPLSRSPVGSRCLRHPPNGAAAAESDAAKDSERQRRLEAARPEEVDPVAAQVLSILFSAQQRRIRPRLQTVDRSAARGETEMDGPDIRVLIVSQDCIAADQPSFESG